MPEKNIIVLGGAGYIGSHTCLALQKAGYTPIVIDNLSRGHRDLCAGMRFEQADILDTPALVELFKTYNPLAVIHFAALIEVGESVKNPDAFYKNNVEGTRSVLVAMGEAALKNIVFSSTAAVYGQPEVNAPLDEAQAIAPINPYGETKVAAESLIRSREETDGIKSVCLRYFNAAGADERASIGEAHFPETHLVPLVVQTALGMRSSISIYGQNYDTKDGTCMRDYIHVSDLADAHIKAVEYLLAGGETTVCNLGSGSGYTVREIIDAVTAFSDSTFDVQDADVREGDPAYLVADNAKAKAILGWEPRHDLNHIIKTAYSWHNTDLYRRLWTEHAD